MNSKRHGQGKMTLANKSYYVGEWLNDVKSGKGSNVAENGDISEGMYYDGKLNGEGAYTFVKENEKYEGTFKNGEFDGYGVYTYNNGDIYEGGWKNGFKNGVGVTIFKDGKKLMAEYVNDKKDGQSLLISGDTKVICQYKTNQVDGEHVTVM